MVRRAIFILALVTAMCVSLAAVADGPLTGSIEARKVITSDKGREQFVGAETALPNDVIEYRLTYANNGQQALNNITVTDPIPMGTEYVSSTATKPQSGEVLFSIDNGTTYHLWPVMIKKTTEDGREIEVAATPEMVTHIRWAISGRFEPQSEITFSYRAVIK